MRNTSSYANARGAAGTGTLVAAARTATATTSDPVRCN
jgi:hypothetical protein